jgi:uncharacterized protein (TIGR03435 family)
MKLSAHVEEREQDTFALVIARSDGRLGPQLKRSTLDCSPRQPGSPPPPPPLESLKESDFLNRCGGMFGQGVIVSGGISMDRLVPSLGGLAGRLVNDRTGLQGDYALTLKFSPPGRAGTSQDAPVPGDPPEFFTALQEQLGLKLQPEKTMGPVFVIDHIERPTENYRFDVPRTIANTMTPSSARVLAMASTPDSIIVVVRTNVSISRDVARRSPPIAQAGRPRAGWDA